MHSPASWRGCAYFRLECMRQNAMSSEPPISNTPLAPGGHPVIRTYAKDMATAQKGKSLVETGSAVSAPPTSAPVTPTPAAAPREAQPAMVQTAATGEREEVLARLRMRAGSAPPLFGQPPVIRRMLPQAAQELPRVARPPQLPPTPELSPLHTYKSDFAEHVEKTEATSFSVLAAEQDAGSAPEPEASEPRLRKGLVLGVLGVLFILVGGGGAYVAYRYVVGAPALSPQFPIPSLIFADERVDLSGAGSDVRDAFAAAVSAALPAGAVRIVYLSRATSTLEGMPTKEVLGGDALFALLVSRAPPILARNVRPDSTIGIVHTGGESRAFFILKTGSYESTFRGMLDWEKTLAEDLSAFYPAHPGVQSFTGDATTTPATSTPALLPLPLPQFLDETVASNDVRVLRDGADRSVLMYGYRDKSTLIIARDAEAFAELSRRLSATRQQ